jgi:hypothetical protein
LFGDSCTYISEKNVCDSLENTYDVAIIVNDPSFFISFQTLASDTYFVIVDSITTRYCGTKTPLTFGGAALLSNMLPFIHDEKIYVVGGEKEVGDVRRFYGVLIPPESIESWVGVTPPTTHSE